MTDKSSHGTHFKVNHETDYTTHKALPLALFTECTPLEVYTKGQTTRGQTTPRRTNLLLESFSEHQETDYKYADKPSPGTPLEVPRDRLHQEHRSLLLAPLLAKYQETSYIDNKQVFSWSLLQNTRRQTTQETMTDNLAFLWVSFRNTPGDRLTNTNKPSSGTSSSVPKDRLRGDIKALPWHSYSQRNYQGKSYIKTDEPSHGTQSWNHETDYIKL